MTRNRGSPHMMGAVLALVLTAVLLFVLGWTSNDRTDNANSDNTGAVGMPNLETNAINHLDANATAVLMRETRVLMKPTQLIMGRTDDGRRSNAPPMNDALALLMAIKPSPSTTTNTVRNC